MRAESCIRVAGLISVAVQGLALATEWGCPFVEASATQKQNIGPFASATAFATAPNAAQRKRKRKRK